MFRTCSTGLAECSVDNDMQKLSRDYCQGKGKEILWTQGQCSHLQGAKSIWKTPASVGAQQESA